MLKKILIKKNDILFYGKFFLLPVLLIKFLTLALIFQSTFFEYDSCLLDYLSSIVYLLIYSTFLIPLFDFPLACFLSFIRLKRDSHIRRSVLSILFGIEVSLVVCMLSLISSILIIILSLVFDVPSCHFSR